MHKKETRMRIKKPASFANSKLFIGLLIVYFLAVANWLNPTLPILQPLAKDSFMRWILFLPSVLVSIGFLIGKRFFKILASILIPIAFFSALLGVLAFLFPTKEPPKEALQSIEFKAIHALALKQSFNNIAVLPEGGFFVVDGIVINPKRRTFGEEPEIRFYAEYYKNGASHGFDSLQDLFEEKDISLTVDAFNRITERMKKAGIGDIARDQQNNIIVYSFDMSAMWGANGIFYSRSGEIPIAVRGNFGQIERLDNHFFSWSSD
jgi:hypothetical protein